MDEIRGFSAVAAVLREELDWRVSRQAVHQWWSRRRRTRFPEGGTIAGAAPGGRIRVFDRRELLDWAQGGRVIGSPGRPRKEKELTGLAATG
jgi:hypothetical protein